MSRRSLPSIAPSALSASSGPRSEAAGVLGSRIQPPTGKYALARCRRTPAALTASPLFATDKPVGRKSLVGLLRDRAGGGVVDEQSGGDLAPQRSSNPPKALRRQRGSQPDPRRYSGISLMWRSGNSHFGRPLRTRESLSVLAELLNGHNPCLAELLKSFASTVVNEGPGIVRDEHIAVFPSVGFENQGVA